MNRAARRAFGQTALPLAAEHRVRDLAWQPDPRGRAPARLILGEPS